MGWFSPWLLLGMLAVAIPIALHFFYRARHRKVPWGAMHFLKLAIEQTSRRLKFQEYVLLAIRCLALMLLAFALARPHLSGSGGSGGSEAVDAVFLFDTSYSMGAELDDELKQKLAKDNRSKELAEATTRLELAKAAALAVLDKMPDHSTVRVIGVSTEAVDYGPLAPENREQVKAAIREVKLTGQGTDYQPALAAAKKVLDRGKAVNREVFLFGDLSKSGFEQQAEAFLALAKGLKDNTTLLVVRCGSETKRPVNAAVTDITFPTSVPHEGTELPVTVILKNSGDAPVMNSYVSVKVEGGERTEKLLVEKIPPGQTAVTVNLKLPGAGIRTVTAKLVREKKVKDKYGNETIEEIAGDDVPGDNRYDRTISIRDRVNLLVVDGGPPRGEGLLSAGDAFAFIASRIQQDPNSDSVLVRTTVITPAEAAPGLLAANDIVVLANVPAFARSATNEEGLSEEFVLRLAEFVNRGGGLVVAAGANVLPKEYNAAFGRQGTNLLPYELDSVLVAEKDREYRFEPDSIPQGSFLAPLRDGKARVESLEVKIRSMVSPGMMDETAQVLLATTDKRPVVSAKPVGRGEVVFVATGMDNRWGNWAEIGETGTLPMFVQVTVSHFVNRAGRGTNFALGQTIRWTPPEGGEYDLVRPDGSRSFVGKPGGGESKSYSLEARAAGEPGVYRFERVMAPDESGKTPPSDLVSPPFAVNPDTTESEQLTAASEGEIETAFGFMPTILSADGDLASERSRREWTVYLLIALFAVAVFEAYWAWRCGRVA